MSETLGDGFSKRKQLESDIETWINRLRLAGRDTESYSTKNIQGTDKFIPIPGSKKTFRRNYTIEECRSKIQELIEDDRKLAIRISLTNQVAKAKLLDLDNDEKELTIPELLVLRNDIAPRLESMLRTIPLRSSGVNILEETEEFLKYRNVNKQMKRVQEMGEKGQVTTNDVIDFYNVEDVTDYGLPQRDIYDEIDKVHAYIVRIKEAINQANKTPLVVLPP